MNIQLLSDLHFEFYKDRGKAILDSLDPSGVDVLVLAGDIDTSDTLYETLDAFASKFPHVVFVAGNHEYYGTSTTDTDNLLAGAEATIDNLTWLNNRMVEIEGIKFVGGTLWFPKPPPAIYAQRQGMNDYRVIRDFEPWVYEQHMACAAVLQGLAAKADVVVTHHLPSYVCVAPRFRGSSFNHYFCYDMTNLIRSAQPKLWLYGHTHDRQDHLIGSTRLVSNPLGYPHEPQDPRGIYRPKLVFKV
jgi:predicted phosphodiesterase